MELLPTSHSVQRNLAVILNTLTFLTSSMQAFNRFPRNVLCHSLSVTIGLHIPGSSGCSYTCQCRRSRRCRVQFLCQEDSLEEEMATHSSILAWKNPWSEEPGRLQSMGLQGVEHDLATEHKHTDFPTNGSKRVELSWIEYSVMRAKLMAALLPRPARFVLDGNSRPAVNSDQLS